MCLSLFSCAKKPRVELEDIPGHAKRYIYHTYCKKEYPMPQGQELRTWLPNNLRPKECVISHYYEWKSDRDEANENR